MAGVRLLRLLAIAGPALLLACATPARRSMGTAVPLTARLQGPGLLFEVVYAAEDASEVRRIEQELLAAGNRATRWGSFREGVVIRVFPDHASLEEAVDRHGYPWLRAWAFGNQILLQSPRTWSPDAAAQDAELAELLTHELTHALMYQLMQPALAWAAEEPPLWFREGLASVTADQGHRRPSIQELRRWAAANPGADLLRPPADLYRDEKEAVYGAAHRTFELLLRTAGEDAIRDLLRRASSGAAFAEAFRGATGHDLAAFERATIQSGFDLTALRFEPATGAGGP
jgi:hypothetical protein